MYSNVYTSSPYILGSTLRGAILRHLIDRYCKALDELQKDNPGFHSKSKCQRDCPIRELFFEPTRFSFGWFDGDSPENIQLLGRISLDRETNSVAERALLSIEARYDDSFRFDVMISEERFISYIEEGAKLAGEWGIGRFKGVGWGRFKIQRVSYNPPSVSTPDKPTPNELILRFRTPYVLEEGAHPPLGKEIVQSHIDEALGEAGLVKIKEVKGFKIPSISYVRRWSYEKNQRENRLVAESRTELIVVFEQAPTIEQLQLLSWGIGEWGNCGFGSFVADPPNSSSPESHSSLILGINFT